MRPKWLENLVNNLFLLRYIICFVITIAIIAFSIFLYSYKHWHFKDIAQVCTGFFIVITLFFTALNYEFTANKTLTDRKSAKDTLTFSTAAEWHKPPLRDYQRVSIQFEDQFMASKPFRTIEDFENFINDPTRIDFKESVKGILNYFETVSIGVSNGLIDNAFIEKFYRSIFRTYYVDYYFYINNRRVRTGNHTVWVNFTNLAEEWHKDIKNAVTNKILNSPFIS